MSDLVEQIKADRALALGGVPPMSHFVSVAARERAVIDWTRAKERRQARLGELEDAYLAAHARIEAQAALIADLTEALRPFCFFDADHPKTDTTQRAWDIRYTDRFRDWIGFDDIEAARDALARAEEAQK